MATKKAAPKFSNKHIEIIADSLPQPKDKRKQEVTSADFFASGVTSICSGIGL